MTSAEARFSKSLRPQKPEGSLGRTAQDGHLDSHTAPELCQGAMSVYHFICKLPLRKCTQTTSLHCGCHGASHHMIWNTSFPLHAHCLIPHNSQALLRGVALILHTATPQKSWGIAVAWPAVVACYSCLWRPWWLSVLSIMPDPVLVVVVVVQL